MEYTKSTRQGKNIFVVDMKSQKDKVLSEIAHFGINKYQNIGIIVNKKGYSRGVICDSCGHIPKCQNCDISISYYQNDRKGFFGICNVCKTIYNERTKCPSCQSTQIRPYGIGSQKLSEYIYDTYQIHTTEISRATTISKNKTTKLFEQINSQSKHIILGTTLLTTPIKGIDFDCLIFQNADIGQNLPNYDSNYNSFMSLYHTISKHTNTKNFVIQTNNPDSDVIKYIYNMDIDGFIENDNEKRKIHRYPPYGEIASLLYKHEMETRLFNSVNKLYQEIIFMKSKYISGLTDPIYIGQIEQIEVFATPPMVYKIYNKYRYNIVIKGPKIREFLEYIYIELNIGSRGFKVDRGGSGI